MRGMTGKLRTGLATYGLALGLAFSPVAAQELQIRDGYIPIDFLKKKPGVHYFLRGERAGMPEDSFCNIFIPEEKVGAPGLAISGLEPYRPYKISVTECDKEGNCTEEGGYHVREAKTRK